MKNFVLALATAATLLVGTLATPSTAEAQRWGGRAYGYRPYYGYSYRPYSYGYSYRPYYSGYYGYRPYYSGYYGYQPYYRSYYPYSYGYGYPGYYRSGYGYPYYGSGVGVRIGGLGVSIY